jgi:hypothetical protein
MPRSYEDVADAAQDAGSIDPQDVTDREIQAAIADFVEEGGGEVADDMVEAAKDQIVRYDSGARAGKRDDMTVWQDRWGNLMAQNTKTGTRRKLVDKEDI